MIFVFAAVFAIIGLLFLIVNYLNDEADTKGWGIFFIIISAVLCLVKYYLNNPEPINNFFRSIFSK
jgi:predicted membrane channel-forming protein YqfA (hemolysin III family)